MEEKIKQHAIIFIAVALLVHLCTAYVAGSIDPSDLSADTRESQMMIFIYLQIAAHYCWFNREKISRELKK